MDAFSDGTKPETSDQTTAAPNKTRTLVRGTIPSQFFHPTPTVDPVNSNATQTNFGHEKVTNSDKYPHTQKQQKQVYGNSKQQQQHQHQQQQPNNTVQRKINQHAKDAQNDTVLNIDQFASTDSRTFAGEKQKKRDRSTKNEALKFAFSVLPESIQSAIYGRKEDDDDDGFDLENGRTKSRCCIRVAKATSIALLGCFFLAIVFSIFLGILSSLGFVAIEGHVRERSNGDRIDNNNNNNEKDDESWNAMHDGNARGKKEEDSVSKTPVDKFRSKLKSKDGFQQNVRENKSPSPSPKDDVDAEQKENFNFESRRENDQKTGGAKKQTIVKSLNVKNYATKSRDGIDFERRHESVDNELAVKGIAKMVEFFLNENEDLIVEYDVKKYFGYDPDLDDFIGTDYVCCCKTDFLNFCGNEDVFLKEFDYKFSYVILKDPPPSSSFSDPNALLKNHEKEESRWKLIVYINDAMLRSNKLECHFVGTVFTIATTKLEESANAKRKGNVGSNKNEQKSKQKPSSSSSSSSSSSENLKRNAPLNDLNRRHRNKEHFYDGKIDKSDDEEEEEEEEEKDKDKNLFFEEAYRDKKNSASQKKFIFAFDFILDRLYHRWLSVMRYIFGKKGENETFDDDDDITVESILTKTENKHHIT